MCSARMGVRDGCPWTARMIVRSGWTCKGRTRVRSRPGYPAWGLRRAAAARRSQRRADLLALKHSVFPLAVFRPLP
ncbi:hypothetical protein BN940_09656 [Castellaniella defragrans 65Phen]|uniref:Uncharacterized protein n=1 Tax=Castellaniella defragrans (strain DSM 12143 / CCUG 39792 / 65Phen) TaxID=1437824 RepID=W8X4H3_CASD6|nr:hypothetical protein BN940_09656 [Castellaniella defragrans 65Phen]